MPAITLTWNARIFTPHDGTPYGEDYIYQLVLRDQISKQLIPEIWGLYIIENGGKPIYAGQAQDIRDRFSKRGRVLREFGLRPTVALQGRRVRYATVNPAVKRALAEQWLVRILYLADQENHPHVLQNVDLTGEFLAPEDGLTITNAGTPPDYLEAEYNYNANKKI